MTRDIYWLGCCPSEEAAVPVGAEDYATVAKAQCRAYIDAIRAVCGPEPEGARLVVRSQPHDFGSYYEVAVVFDGNDQAAAAYATKCDEQAPTTWAQAGMEPPVTQVSEWRAQRLAFAPGSVVATVGAMRVASNDQIAELLSRHLSGDWGEVDAEDKRANDAALRNGARILSAYTVRDQKLWFITEADRSATTVLTPDEY